MEVTETPSLPTRSLAHTGERKVEVPTWNRGRGELVRGGRSNPGGWLGKEVSERLSTEQGPRAVGSSAGLDNQGEAGQGEARMTDGVLNSAARLNGHAGHLHNFKFPSSHV